VTFPLDIRTELELGGMWTDISPDVYVRDTKQITRGLRDQGSSADPSSLRLTLDNRAGKYSPRNAMSPLFGLIGRNTPIRVSLPSDGDHYLQLDGRDANFVSTPDTSALDITGDLDVRAEIAPDWYGPANQVVIGKWDRTTGQESWFLQVADGLVLFRFSTDGTGAGERYFSQPLPQLPERAAIRATLDVDNGAGGNTVTFYWAPSLDGAWTLVGKPVTVTAGTSPIFAGSAPLRVGFSDYRGGTYAPRHPLNGRGYRFEVRNGINGSVVASPDFRAVTPGAVTFVDSSALTWTLNGAAEVRDREDRFVGEVASWPLRWSTDDADRYVPITANGILRRLGQGAKALDSTLRRRIPSGNPVAYWPMEEQQDAVQAYSPIPGVFPASVSSVEWASFGTLPSSAPLPKLTGTSSLSAPVPAFTPGQWQVEFVYNADDNIPIGEDVELVKILSSNGVVRRWVVLLRNGRATVQGYSSTNVQIVTQTIAVGADVFHGWTRLRFWAIDDADGVGFTWRISWQDVGGDTGAFTGTYPTGTCGSVTMISADWPALTAGWGVGHLAVLREAGSTLYDGSDDAYLGETAVERMRRLSAEESLSFTRTPGALPVAPVGFQRQDSLVNLFEAAAEADGGLFTEDMTRIGLHYRDRSSLYAQTPLFELSYEEPGLGPDIDPVDDDSAIVNDVTVTRDGGSSGRAVLESGPLSVNAAPDGIGKYDASYTLSLADDNQAEPTAYWRLHLGTHDGARYPTVSLMLHKPGAEWLIPYVLRMREGDKIRITDLPEWVSHDDVELLVMGWSESLDLYTWELTLNCVPAGPWDTAVTDHPQFATADTDGSIVATAATSTETKLYVRTTAGPLWTADPAELPYYIKVSGEEMRVTSVTQSVSDTFTRTGTNGWATADSGQAWIRHSTAPLSDYSTTGSKGQHSLTTRNVYRIQSLDSVSLVDAELLATVTMPIVPVGDGAYAYFLLRTNSDVTSFYFARVYFAPAATAQLSIRKRVPTETLLGTAASTIAHAAGDSYTVRFRVEGATLSAKLWKTTSAEPSGWQVVVSDTDLAGPGGMGLRTLIGTNTTNTLPVNVTYDDVSITDSQAFTVDRSLNGVVKAQAVGTAVNVAVPPVTSL
jgi:hypothetical protein